MPYEVVCLGVYVIESLPRSGKVLIEVVHFSPPFPVYLLLLFAIATSYACNSIKQKRRKNGLLKGENKNFES